MMMACRFVAKSAIRPHLLRPHHRQLKNFSSRALESAPPRSAQGSQSSGRDHRFLKNEVKDEGRKNWKAWAKAAAGGGLVSINLPFFLLKYAEYSRLSLDGSSTI